jgi:hypothetical protein
MDVNAKAPPMTDRGSPAYQQMTQFALDHRTATTLLLVATQDYAAARCLAQNLLMTSLIVGAQAIEKFLKVYLLFVDPSRNVRKLNHSLTQLLIEVDGLFPHLSLPRFSDGVERFGRHYQIRYPDNANASTSMTTADIFELDELIVFLNESMPCPRNVKYRTGLYAAITFSLGYGSTVTPTEHWIKLHNRPLSPLLPRIREEYMAVMEELHPQKA